MEEWYFIFLYVPPSFCDVKTELLLLLLNVRVWILFGEGAIVCSFFPGLLCGCNWRSANGTGLFFGLGEAGVITGSRGWGLSFSAVGRTAGGGLASFIGSGVSSSDSLLITGCCGICIVLYSVVGSWFCIGGELTCHGWGADTLPGSWMTGALWTTGVYCRRNFRFLSVTLPDPSIRMTYWS